MFYLKCEKKLNKKSTFISGVIDQKFINLFTVSLIWLTAGQSKNILPGANKLPFSNAILELTLSMF